MLLFFSYAFANEDNPVVQESAENTENPAEEKSEPNLNLNNVSIRVLISAISEMTGKNFIIDPSVSGKVSFVSGDEIPESELYNTFLLILQSYNFEAVEIGNNLFRIMPSNNAKKTNTRILDYLEVKKSPELVTTIIALNHISAQQAFEIIRPLIPDQSHLAIYGPSNSLIVASSEQTINQIRTILKIIDTGVEEDKTELIQLENSSVTEIIQSINSLTPKDNTASLSISADIRTNTLLIRGREKERGELKEIIEKLDAPLTNSNSIEIIHLNYLTATETAEILTRLMAGSIEENNGNASNNNEINIQANETTNSLIVRSNNVQLKTIRQLIEKIDTRKPQVLVEAIIADVSDDFALELGIQWAGIKKRNGVGSINFSASSNPLSQIAAGALNNRRDLIAQSLGSGAVAGVALGNWGMLLNALQNNSNANVLSRPSIVTLDNQEAEIFVGENVPFISSSVGGDSPTTNVERAEIGIKLKVKPKINPDSKVTMEIEQEISALSPSTQQTTKAVDLITQSRKISTQVSMDDNEIIVLGGLTSDQSRQVDQKVPLLSDIPLLGSLFSYETQGVSKKSLMIFLRVVILPENSSEVISDIYQRETQIPILDPPPSYDEVIQDGNFANQRALNSFSLKLLPPPF